MPLSFVWLALMILPTLAILLSMLTHEDRMIYLSIAAPMALLPLAVGTASAFILYFRHKSSAASGRDAEGTVHES